MTYKTRRRIWPLALMSLAVVGVLAVVVALSVGEPKPASAQEDCDSITNVVERAQCLSRQAAPTPTPDATPDATQQPQTGPQVSTFVANAAAGRTVELEWPSIAGATSYLIRYRNRDIARAPWTTVTVTGQTHTLADDDMEDGALYQVELRGNNQSWDDARSLEILGPVIQFSTETPLATFTGEPVDWELPHTVLVRGDTVRYSIVPALPAGLSYGQDAGKAYIDLADGVNPRITGGVAHVTGGSEQFYRLKGCDVDDGIVDETSCDTHIFKIIVTPATVKPLADVIRDREYTVGVALNATHPRNNFPQVGLDAGSGFTYRLLNTDGYRDLNLAGLTFDGATRQLSGTPERSALGEHRVAYRASQAGSEAYHEAEFTITVIEIQRQECRVGLNYETTQRVYNRTATVGAANFTVGVDAGNYYVLPIGEKGQRGAGENRTRTFELITVEREGGDLSAPEAYVLPAGLQVVKLQVDDASINPLNDLYTRQGLHTPAGAVDPQTLDMAHRYQDPEPNYPGTDDGYRLALGVSNAGLLVEEQYLSCFIVHDTDNDTGETDSSAVVFSLNVLPNLSARDWVIELEGDGDTSELDVDEAFTTEPELLDFEVMFVDDGAAMNASGCIGAPAANPREIVTWDTGNDTVEFTAIRVSEPVTQRVQVKAALKSGGAEACVQIRITVLPEPEPLEPAVLGAPTNVMATVDGSDPGSTRVTITWTDGANADGHEVGLVDLSDYRVAHEQRAPTGMSHTFSNVASGRYMAIVVSTQDTDFKYEVAIVTVP